MGVAYQACDVWYSLGCQSMNDSPYLPSSNQWPIWPLMGKCDLTYLINSTFDPLSDDVADLDDCPRCLDAWIDCLRWPSDIDILPGTDPFGCRYIQHHWAKRTRE